MTIKKITCIECPQGCSLTVEMGEGTVVRVTGNRCGKGESYAQEECVNPVRTLTSSVVAEGLSLRIVPVKTDKPIPKVRIFDAMNAIRGVKLSVPVDCGDIVVANFLDLGVNLIATRAATCLSE